jgi:hypothetical protein
MDIPTKLDQAAMIRSEMTAGAQATANPRGRCRTTTALMKDFNPIVSTAAPSASVTLRCRTGRTRLIGLS